MWGQHMIYKGNNIKYLAILLICFLINFSSCGDHEDLSNTPAPNPSSSDAMISLSIKWPKSSTSASRPSKLIPSASNAITVEIYKGATLINSKTIARPTIGDTSTIDFEALPIGTLTITATSYPDSDGTGVAQARGTTQVTTEIRKTSNIKITMESTIDHIGIYPNNIFIGVGESQILTPTAYDKDGAIVLVDTTWEWIVLDTSVASFDSKKFTVTGVSKGNTVIELTENESKKTVSSDISIGVTDLIAPATTATTELPIININTPVKYSIIQKYSDGSEKDVSSLYDWSVSLFPPNDLTYPVVKLSINNGLFTTDSIGTYTIIAKNQFHSFSTDVIVFGPQSFYSISHFPIVASGEYDYAECASNDTECNSSIAGSYNDGIAYELSAISSVNYASIDISNSGPWHLMTIMSGYKNYFVIHIPETESSNASHPLIHPILTIDVTAHFSNFQFTTDQPYCATSNIIIANFYPNDFNYGLQFFNINADETINKSWNIYANTPYYCAVDITLHGWYSGNLNQTASYSIKLSQAALDEYPNAKIIFGPFE